MSERIGVWPELAVSQWADTRDTLQLMTQVVGKVRMVNTPLMSHWWNVVLYVSARGLTTGLIPHGDRGFQVDFDFIEHQLVVATTVGQRRSVPLRAGPIAQFYREVMATLDELGVSTHIWPMPVEIADAIAFDRDTLHVAYDQAAVHRFWLALVQINRVFEIFRARYLGKVSPVHFFWGAADLAVTRFSGRPAPKHPGRCAQLRPARHVGGVLARGEQRRYWPGPDGEGGSSTPMPTPSRRVPSRCGPSPGAASFDESAGRVHPALHRRSASTRSRRRAAGIPAEHLCHRGRHRRLGPPRLGAQVAGRLQPSKLPDPNRGDDQASRRPPPTTPQPHERFHPEPRGPTSA